MTAQQEMVKLENLGSGAAAEMFADELERVIENIMDPNTKPDAVRSVTLKVKIKPNKDRDFCSVEISCDPKLAPVIPFETHMYVGLDKGKAVATEFNPQQGRLTTTNQDGEEVDVKTGQIINMHK